MTPRFRPSLRVRFTRANARDLDDEFGFHLDMRTAQLERGGLSRDAARAEALRQFGNIDDARAFCRAEDNRRMRRYRWSLWLHDLRDDARITVRTLLRQPTFAAATVLTLAVAIAIATSVYGVLHGYLVRPLPYPDPERLVQVIAGPSREPFQGAPSLARVDWTPLDGVFAETVTWDLDGFTLPGGARPEFVDGAWVSPGYFSALGQRPAIGRGFLPAEFASGTQVAILSHSLWTRRYGADSTLVGRTIRAHSTDRPLESELVTVVGIMPADAWHVSRFTDVLRPLFAPRMPSLAKLAPGMTLAEAERRLNAVVLPQLGDANPRWSMSLVTLQDEYTHEVRPVLVALLGAALFLLLIGAASVGGIQVARAAARRGEFQVRVALGASRQRIIGQLLTESLVISAAAAVLGTTLTILTVRAIAATMGAYLGVGVPGGADRLSLGPEVLLASIGIATAICVAFSVLPTLTFGRAANANSSGGTRGILTFAPSRLLRRILVVTQLAFTVMLLAGAGLMARTLSAIGGERLGFTPDGLVKAELLLPVSRYGDAAARRGIADRVVAAVASTPGVRGVALASPHPFRGVPPGMPIEIEGAATPNQAIRAVSYIVTPHFFETLDIPVRDGRAFGPTDAAGFPATVIISEQLARRAAVTTGSMLGRRLRIGADTTWRSIVGVVGEIREPVAAMEQQPEVYLPYAQSPRMFFSVMTRVSGDPTLVGSALQRAVAGVDDALALATTETMTDVVAREGQRPRALAMVLGLFGVLALGVSMLGLYGSLSYVIAQRRREIAIRIAVGAQAAAIRRLVMAEGFLLVAVGLGLGTAAALAGTRAIGSLLYGIVLADAATYLGTGVVLGVAALAACAVPVRRAVRLPPAEIMRAD